MSKVKEIQGKEFRTLQMIQFQMLIEFDRVCRKNNIHYSIDGGTLLGAVRHKGFIPWDDDIDIAMLREDYEKLKTVVNEFDPEICFFQDHETDPAYRWGYGKLRRTGTVFIRAGQEHINCKTGVFIDIFPLDDVPKSLAGQMMLDFFCFCLRKILWSEVGKYNETNRCKRFGYFLLSKISPKVVFSLSGMIEKKSRNNSENRVRILLLPSNGKYYDVTNPIRERYSMPKEWYRHYVEYEFEGVRFWGIKEYDAYLKYVYGDYMSLPPETDRIAHAPVSYYDFNGLGGNQP